MPDCLSPEEPDFDPEKTVWTFRDSLKGSWRLAFGEGLIFRGGLIGSACMKAARARRFDEGWVSLRRTGNLLRSGLESRDD